MSQTVPADFAKCYGNWCDAREACLRYVAVPRDASRQVYVLVPQELQGRNCSYLIEVKEEK